MATENGSGIDPTIDGSERFDGAGQPIGDSVNGEPGLTENGAVNTAALAGEKRGRGRPRKDGSSAGAGSGQASGSGQNGSKSSGQKAASGMAVEVFATQLQGLHAILAKVTKNPLWEISDAEALKLAKAIKEVMALHQITIPTKYMVYGNLFAIGATIYGPRLALMALHQQNERNKNSQTFDAATGTPVAS